MNRPKKITIVFSVFNENESLELLFQEILRLFKDAVVEFEVIFVDDGSSDSSAKSIKTFIDNNVVNRHTLKLIRFSRNFGHEAAMIAGIDHAKGDAVICMDADLQHPLSMIPSMIGKFREGFEIVTMARKINYGNTNWQRFLSKNFYRLFNFLSKEKISDNSSDFFLVSGKVAEILRSNYREKTRFLRSIIQTVGFNHTSLEFDAPKRQAGKTKYSPARLLILSSEALTSFSKAPLYLGIWFGFIFAFFSILLGVYTIGVYFFGETPPSGYTTIVLFVTFSFSILFFIIGIIGIYVGYLFEEQKARPIYIVKEIFDSGSSTANHIAE